MKILIEDIIIEMPSSVYDQLKFFKIKNRWDSKPEIDKEASVDVKILEKVFDPTSSDEDALTLLESERELRKAIQKDKDEHILKLKRDVFFHENKNILRNKGFTDTQITHVIDNCKSYDLKTSIVISRLENLK